MPCKKKLFLLFTIKRFLLQQKDAELKKLKEELHKLNEEITKNQKQNSTILKENQTIQTSFNNLLHTARNEIQRKDQLINQLRKE